MEIVAIIPARYNSTRFPGKPLAIIAGKPMVQHVYERVAKVKGLNRVIVATDDERIYQQVKLFDGEAVMTSINHVSGTDRLAEVAEKIGCDLIVNVQGDEPLIDPEMVEAAIQPFYQEQGLVMGTLKKKIEDQQEVEDPNVVKVVTDRDDYALYFSRSPIPYERKSSFINYYKHIGLYVYRKNFLLSFSQLEPTALEKTESLEQLRVLENGFKIKVMETTLNSIGVDTPEDIKKVEELIKKGV